MTTQLILVLYFPQYFCPEILSVVSLLFSLGSARITLECCPTDVTIALEAEVHSFIDKNPWVTIRPTFPGDFKALVHQII